MYGFGGSTTAMGATPPTPGADSKHDAAVQVPVLQSFCSIASLSGAPGGQNERLHNQISIMKVILLLFRNEHAMFHKSTGLDKYQSDTVKQIDDTQEEANYAATFVDYGYHYEYSHKSMKTREDYQEIENMYGECSQSVKNYVRYRFREHTVFTLMPLFTNSDWDLIEKRERSDFQYKEILIPFKCPDRIHFILPAGKTYSCDLLPTQVYVVVAKSGLFDKYLEDTKGTETADDIDAINMEMHDGLDD
jgi:hypothetical protein